MSEYSEYIYSSKGAPMQDMCSEVSLPREKIVRCRDCKFYDEIIHACERFDSIKQDNVSYVFDDGFCAWGERRNDD